MKTIATVLALTLGATAVEIQQIDPGTWAQLDQVAPGVWAEINQTEPGVWAEQPTKIDFVGNPSPNFQQTTDTLNLPDALTPNAFIPDVLIPAPDNGCGRYKRFDFEICSCVSLLTCDNICTPPLIKDPIGGCDCLTQMQYDRLFNHDLNDQCLPEPEPDCCCGCGCGCCDCCDHDDEVKCPRGFFYNEEQNRCQRLSLSIVGVTDQ